MNDENVICGRKTLEELREVAQFAALLDYWHGFRIDNQGTILGRNDIRPQDIQHFLPWTFIADTNGKFDMTVRLSATAIDEILDFNLTGTNMFDRYAPEKQELYWRFFQPILTGNIGGYTHRILIGKWEQQIQYESMYLPIRNRDGTNTALIGATSWAPMEQDFQRRLKVPEKTVENFSRINEISHLSLDKFVLVGFDTAANL